MALETLLTIAAREHEITPEALEAYRAKSLATAEQATVRNGVAIVAATGPMMKRANLFSAISGATSYEIMARDLTAARDDPKVKAAILNLDTPGGEASGAGELAAMVKSFASVKPIVAYVNGTAASAGYWIASGATQIVVDPTAMLGSIGAMFTLKVADDPKGSTTYKFISSQSPMKNADPASNEGAAHLQTLVDAMAQVFIEDVARNRGIATETVLSDFGKGGMFIGQDAVNAGLADRVGNFEGVLTELSKGRLKVTGKGATMSEQTFTAADMSAAVANAVADAMTQANARTAGVHALGVGFGLDAAALTAALAGSKTVAELAIELAPAAATARTAAIDTARTEGHAAGVVEGKSAKRTAAVTALKGDEEVAAKAGVSADNEDEAGAETAATLAARIAAA
jgi:ClpP class serine protease